MSQPPSTQSVAEMRTKTGSPAGNSAARARTPAAENACGFRELPPYSVCAEVAEGREEFVQQVTVGRVHLDELETGGQRPSDGLLERRHDVVQSRLVEGDRRRIPFAERNGTRPDDGPAPALRCLQSGAAEPGNIAARLAAGVGQLNAGDCSLGMNEAGDARQGLDVLVAPNAHVLRRDSSLGGDGRRLDHDQSDAACRPAAQMHEVPIVGQPVVGAVLTHRRHDDPIAKRDAANRQRAEQVDIGNLPVMLGSGGAAMGRGKRSLLHAGRRRSCRFAVLVSLEPGFCIVASAAL